MWIASEIEGEQEKGESKHKRKREGKQMGPTQIHQLIETQTSKRCADPQDHKHQRKRDAYTHKYDRKQSRDHLIDHNEKRDRDVYHQTQKNDGEAMIADDQDNSAPKTAEERSPMHTIRSPPYL